MIRRLSWRLVGIAVFLFSVRPEIFVHELREYTTSTHQDEHFGVPLDRSFGSKRQTQGEKIQQIRRWGCDGRNETPLIFVHIGKSGGGSIRARLAASSLDYNRSEWNFLTDRSYYPVRDGPNGEMHQGRFCNSITYRGHRTFQFRVQFICNASTPLGRAIACPMPKRDVEGRLTQQECKFCHPSSETCRIVYTGHPPLGSEMHWLPSRYLSKWWSDQWAAGDSDEENVYSNEVASLWKTLLPGGNWCRATNTSRPFSLSDYENSYNVCSEPLQERVDSLATEHLRQKLGNNENAKIWSWAPIYASLPLLRVTVVRDPFSWLLSKFIWHRDTNWRKLKCENVEDAVLGGDDDSDIGMYPIFRPWNRSMNFVEKGWATQMALGFIIMLCGPDCEVRNIEGTASLTEMEQQAADNLRQSFAVVGLVNESNVFLEMVSTRVDYMNTSLNREVEGKRHATSPKQHERHCKALYADPSFQQELVSRSPAVAALVRLYNVAVEVNRVQLNEIRQCGYAIG